MTSTPYSALLSRWSGSPLMYATKQTSVRLEQSTLNRLNILKSSYPQVSLNKIINDLLACSLDSMDVPL